MAGGDYQRPHAGDAQETSTSPDHLDQLKHTQFPDEDKLETRSNESHAQKRSASRDWQLVEGRSKKRRKDHGQNRRPDHEHKSSANDGKIGRKQEHDTRPTVICAAPHTINSSLRINDLQSLVLYCLADGVGPQWISVRHRTQIRKAVVLMVPGLEKGIFTGDTELDGKFGSHVRQEDQLAETTTSAHSKSAGHAGKNPDEYLPTKLDAALLPDCVKPFAEVFPQLFSVKSPGDDRRAFSPVAAMLSVPLSKSAEEKLAEKSTKGAKAARVAKDFIDEATPVTGFLASAEELLENEFILHPTAYNTGTHSSLPIQDRGQLQADSEHGWQDAAISITGVDAELSQSESSLEAGRKVYAIDCEMCKVQGDSPDVTEFALTRISIVDWNDTVVLDELVKPDKPIVDYLTAFSGMTAEKLAPVKTNLQDIQARLLKMFASDSILVGHSLNSDLKALKITHPFIVDTSLIYPHPKGPPYKSSLKWLTQKYLNREIQKHDGHLGHDSIEDARAALDLVKAKCKHGPRWGTPDASGEDIFKRFARTPRPGPGSGASPRDASLRDCRTGAVVDHGRPDRGLGRNAFASISCSTDDEVVTGINRAVNGDLDGGVFPGGGVDFVFARFRELEAFRGWSTDANPNLTESVNKQAAEDDKTQAEPSQSNTGPSNPDTETRKQRKTLADAVTQLSSRIAAVFASLPKCTLFVVYSGVGDPREMKRLSDLHRQFRREYAVKKWDQLSVRWTDDEEQALKAAVRTARNGVAFAVVK